MELGRTEDIMNQEREFNKRDKRKPLRRRNPKRGNGGTRN